jgi:hypothetical protein
VCGVRRGRSRGARGGYVHDNDVAAVVASDFEAGFVALQADEGNLGASQASHRCAENADGTRPEDDDTVAGMDARVHDHGAVGDAAWLGERGFLDGDAGWHVMKTAGGHSDIASHGAIDTVAEAAAVGVEIVEALARERTVGVDHGGGFAHDAIAFFDGAHIGADGGDDAGELVAEDDGIVDLPTVRRGPLV